MKIALSTLVLISALGLSACGGGGGSDGAVSAAGPVISALTFNLDSAFKALAQNGATKAFASVTGTANSSTCAGTANLAETATSGPVAFNGTTGLSSTRTFSSSYSGCGLSNPTVVTTQYYDTNYIPLGFFTPDALASSTGVYAVYATAPTFPSSLKVGTLTNPTIGTIGTLLKYTDSSKGTSIGSLKFTFALKAETATTALLSIYGQTKNDGGTQTILQEDIYRISATGAPVLISIKLQNSDGTQANLVLQ